MTDKDKKQEPATSIISGERFTETYSVSEDVKTEPSLYMSQELFLLCEADFLRLKHRGSTTQAPAAAVFMVGVGMLLVVLAKLAQARWTKVQPSIEPWEWIAPFCAIALALLLLGIGWLFIPNEKRHVMKNIETHFLKAPRTRHFRGNDK